MRNPKAEGRRPKEGRGPNPEGQAAESYIAHDPCVWCWDDEPAYEALLLKDGDLGGRQPPQPLEERTAQFGEAIIQFAKRIPQTPVNSRLIRQLVGAGISVGANHCEADDAGSGKEFKQKIGTCRKEAKEAMFFLRMIGTAEQELAPEARRLWREAKELSLIFGAIWRKQSMQHGRRAAFGLCTSAFFRASTLGLRISMAA
jgi:four helix bundle protein